MVVGVRIRPEGMVVLTRRTPDTGGSTLAQCIEKVIEQRNISLLSVMGGEVLFLYLRWILRVLQLVGLID